MSREKRRRTDKQQTLGQAVARGARADQPVSLYAEIEEEPQGLLLEKLWVSMKNQYEEAYCSGSPILKLISEDAAPTGGRSTRKTRTDDGIKEEVDAELNQERAGIIDDQSWELAGDHILRVLEPLVNKAHALPIVLQQWLLHMVVNHEFHAGDLSLRALRLLERNARAHPPCALKTGTEATLSVNSVLWVPGMGFAASEGAKLPALFTQFHPYHMFLELWQYALRYCSTDGRGRMGSSRTAAVPRPGYILLLSYCLTLLRLDLDVRMAVAKKVPQDPRAHLTVQHSKLWRLMASKDLSVTNMWTGTMNNHVALTRTLTATLLAGCHSAGAAAATVAGPSREGTPVPGSRGAAGAEQGEPGGLSQRPPCPLSQQEVGAAAGALLRALYDVYEAAESPAFFSRIYDRRGPDKGTNRAYLMDQLLLLLTGTGSKGLDLDPDAQALLARLKDPGAKLVLLRALSPSAQLQLLGLDLADKADKSWVARDARSGVEGIGRGLTGHLALLKEYREARGLVVAGMEGHAEVNAVEVLHVLAPSKPDTPDLYDAATKSLFKLGTSTNERGGFVAWLAAFVRAAVEQQRELQASDPAAAAAVAASQGGPHALRAAFASVRQRMSGDEAALMAGCGLPARLALAAATRLVEGC